jgi:hypothetical protein
MRKYFLVTIIVLAVFSGVQASALEQNHATFAIGTVQTVKVGTVGTLETSSATELVFHSNAGQFAIPYAQVVSYTWRDHLKTPLGILPTIALALVIWPPKTYFITITWRSEQGTTEVATFEVSRLESEGLAALLKARAPYACRPNSGQACGQQW